MCVLQHLHLVHQWSVIFWMAFSFPILVTFIGNVIFSFIVIITNIAIIIVLVIVIAAIDLSFSCPTLYCYKCSNCVRELPGISVKHFLVVGICDAHNFSTPEGSIGSDIFVSLHCLKYSIELAVGQCLVDQEEKISDIAWNYIRAKASNGSTDQTGGL